MAQIKLTKNELKAQKDLLKRFQRYLPTLQLKKQQLQMVIRRVEQQRREVRDRYQERFDDLRRWVAVFADEEDVAQYIRLERLDTDIGNIAGIDIPRFRELVFADVRYDLYEHPPWLDAGVARMKELLSMRAELWVLDEQHRLLSEELRITSQRVNLFEKVKIPQTREHIRTIRIYLGDQETAAVVRGKIAKSKVVRRQAS